MTNSTARKWTSAAFLLLLLNSAYLWAFALPSVFYMANVLAHLLLGIALCLAFVWLRGIGLRGAMVALLGGTCVIGIAAALDHRWTSAHIATSLLATLALFGYVWQRGRADGGVWLQFRNAFAACLGVLLLLPAGSAFYSKAFPNADARIVEEDVDASQPILGLVDNRSHLIG